jgi:hypothetical protein
MLHEAAAPVRARRNPVGTSQAFGAAYDNLDRRVTPISHRRFQRVGCKTPVPNVNWMTDDIPTLPRWRRQECDQHDR